LNDANVGGASSSSFVVCDGSMSPLAFKLLEKWAWGHISVNVLAQSILLGCFNYFAFA
jgi:hypothetical protein